MFPLSRWINWHSILSYSIIVSYWPFWGGARNSAGTMGMFRGHYRFFYCLLRNWVKTCFPNQSQLRTTAWSMIICTQTALFVFFYSQSGGRNNAKYAFQYNQFKNKTGQYGQKKKKKKKEQSRAITTTFAAGLTSSFSLNPTELKLSGANKRLSFARVIAIYEFLVTVQEVASRADVLRG